MFVKAAVAAQTKSRRRATRCVRINFNRNHPKYRFAPTKFVGVGRNRYHKRAAAEDGEDFEESRQDGVEPHPCSGSYADQLYLNV